MSEPDFDKPLMETILGIANSNLNFSDIQIGSGEPIKLKTAKGWINATELMGEVDDFPEVPYVITHEEIQAFVEKIDENYQTTLIERDINRPWDFSTCRLRVNVYLAKGGDQIRVAVRKIPKVPRKLSETGLPASVHLLTENQTGIILISGATGSGKTTTMASILQDINEQNNYHIVTIEDPIEYEFKGNKSFFSQREIGSDCQSFSDGVRSAMRQRPDVIVIGEIRDRETAEQALLAGESGHLVIGTLHANSAVGTVTKMMSFFNGQERETKLQSLSGCLIGVINQTLIPRVDDDSYALAVDLLANHKRDHSKNLGNPDTLQSTLDRSEDNGSVSIGQSISDLVKKKIISLADGLRAVPSNGTAWTIIKNSTGSIK